ncbi:MAG: MFS transporter, partial [Candidatus Omnitrophica bacterium]|nr:MFS transporter [Candidatus Omnitrophota bacterium]
MPRTSFYILCLMFFALSFGVAAMAALVPSIAANFGVEANYAVRLTWLYMLPYGVFALVWAPLTNIFKLKNLFLVICFGFFISSLLFCFSKSIHQAFVFRFLMGAFGCGFVPLSLITVGKAVKNKSRSKYIGSLFAVSYVSTFISVFLSGFLSWRIIYSIPVVLGLTAFILALVSLNDFDFRKKQFKITYLDTLKNKKALCF